MALESVQKGLDHLRWILEHLIFKNREVNPLILPVLNEEVVVDLEKLVDFVKSASYQVLDDLFVREVELVLTKPIVTVEEHLIGRLPLSADSVVPVLKDGLVLVKVWVATPALEDFKALHALKEALVDLHREAVTIRLSLKPETA